MCRFARSGTALLTLGAVLLWVQLAAAGLPRKPVLRSRPVIKRHFKRGNGASPTAEYEEVRDMSIHIMTKFSPKEYYVLGIGHSPAKLVAFLQALSPELGRTIPASRLGDRSKRRQIDGAFAEYRKHFEALLPRAVLQGKRKVLVVDYSSGPSLENFRYALARYFSEKGVETEIVTAAFMADGTKADHWLGDDEEVYDSDEIAEFQYHEHRIGTDSLDDLALDSRWAPRVDNYRSMMRGDAKLDDFLRAHLADLMTPLSNARRRPKTAAKTEEKISADSQKRAPTVGTPKTRRSAQPLLTVQDRHSNAFDVLSLAERRQVSDAVTQLDKAYPAKRFHYLGVGRTSTPFVSFVHALNEGLATYLPIDGVGKSLDAKGQIKRTYHKAYFALFDSLLPTKVKQGKKSVVLLKHTDSGRSLKAVAELLQTYLNAQTPKGWKKNLVLVGFGDSPAEAQELSQHIDISGANELQQLVSGAHKAIAPYEYHQVGRTKRLTPRKAHADYQRRLSELVRKNDFAASLRESLSGL